MKGILSISPLRRMLRYSSDTFDLLEAGVPDLQLNLYTAFFSRVLLKNIWRKSVRISFLQGPISLAECLRGDRSETTSHRVNPEKRILV